MHIVSLAKKMLAITVCSLSVCIGELQTKREVTMATALNTNPAIGKVIPADGQRAYMKVNLDTTSDFCTRLEKQL